MYCLHKKTREKKNLIKILHILIRNAILTGVCSEASSDPHFQFWGVKQDIAENVTGV